MAAKNNEVIEKMAADITKLTSAIDALFHTVSSVQAQVAATERAKTEVKAYVAPLNNAEAHDDEDMFSVEHGGWRLPLEAFINYRPTVKADWSPGGNAKTAQYIAKALRRGSGPAEGQLYLNWRAKMGDAAVKAFWISKGFKEIPAGL